MSIDKVINFYHGFHFEGELRMLNRLADGIHEGCIVAIGSYRGQTDCALALHAHVPVYAIDSRMGSVGEDFQFGDEDRTHWMQNVLALGLGAKIRPINLDSYEVGQMWHQPVSFLFIDGSHDDESVWNDLKAWLPHVIEGGLVALHDSNSADVIRATERWHQYLELVEVSDITSVYRYVPSGDVYSEDTVSGSAGMVQSFTISATGTVSDPVPEAVIDLDEIDQLVNDEIKSDPLDTPVIRPDELSTKRKRKGSK